MAILLRYPNAAAPTDTATFNEVFMVVQPPNSRPYQVQVAAMSGRLYTIEESPNREQIVRMTLSALHEQAESGFDGMIRLRNFLETTLSYSLENCDLTDADGETWTVQYLSGIENIREDGGGRAAAFERFSGVLQWRVII